MPGFHHVEVWVADIERASAAWGWLLERLGFTLDNEWSGGRSWSAGGAYLTLTTSPNLSDAQHDRRRAGVNHLAFHGGPPASVDAVMTEAPTHGWTPLYTERYPHAGGVEHYAGWLENIDGFKAELVADRNPAAAASVGGTPHT
ncbi:VOC family protein [Labedella endophytica]|uniref:Glyoxalase n=1 Tax=Labedella endophytica TaxID=1523160 RepID=A0A3S0VTK1_9MICO|nr:VOC family protein [Labedella endophytica]RUR00998.1 glyoxalase [Labedella endophytica]